MNTILNQLSEYLWLQSWQVALLIGVAFILCRALRHKSAHLRYMVWLVVLAKCLVPPIFHVPVALLPAEAMVQSEPTRGMVDFDPAALSAPEKSIPSQATKASWSRHVFVLAKHHWVVTAWAMVAILVYMISALRMIRIRRSLFGHRKPVPESVQTDLDLVCQRYGVTRRPCAWLFSRTSQPFVWGWLKGTIYLPEAFESKAADQRRAILAHELGHVCRFDAAINLLQVIAQGLFWFHPLVWWGNAQMRKAREQCCDEMAIANLGINAKTYCTALINALVIHEVVPLPMGSLAISSPARHIEERIKTLIRETRFHTRPPAIAILFGSVIAALLISTSCSLCHKPTEIPDEDLATDKHIIIDVLVFESTDGGEEITGFLEDVDTRPFGQSQKNISALLTTTQQERFKNLSHVQTVASPSSATEDGKVTKLSVITEEYFMLDPDSREEPTSVESGLKLEVTPHLQKAEHEMILNIDLEISSTTPSPKSILPIVTKSKVSNTCRLNRDTGILLVGQPHGDDPPLSILITARKVRLTEGGVEPTE